MPTITEQGAMEADQAISITAIKEYIWARYIENEEAEIGISEDEILEFFRDHYTRIPIESDGDSFYFGILMFEKAWEDAERKEEYFFLAREVFLHYREFTGETDWDAVEDRLADIEDFFSDEGSDYEDLAAKYALPGVPVEEKDELEIFREACPPEMVLIPPTVVTLPGQEEPVEVGPFYIDRYPVTVAMFHRFLEVTQYRAPKFWSEEGFKEKEQPVVGVSYFDAEKFADWAGKRLPTHEEWIAAAQHEPGMPFPWGREMNPAFVNCMEGGRPESLEPVGGHPDGSSPHGAEDMLGGVWEWTETWFNAEEEFKIIKGGSYVDPASLLGIETILYASPKEKIDNIGFRCVRPVGGRI
ncbi:MAG: formylglycine-generating enzyme family protein [Planctomycetota bacterium]